MAWLPLLVASLVSAQTPAQKIDERIRSDKNDIRQDKASQKSQIAELNVQEKTAMDAVTADAALSKADRNAAKRKIHADFKAKKDTIRTQMKVDRKAKRADIRSLRAGEK